jgi:hypothetical protein
MVGDMLTLSAADKGLIRALLQARYPEILSLVDVLDSGPLPVEQREAITRAMGVERRMHRAAWAAQGAEIARLMEYIWTSRPLTPEDAGMLREAIEMAAPSLVPLLDNIGTAALTQEQSNALRGAVGFHLIEVGFDREWKPNARGVRLEALIDYLVHCVDDWR